MKLWDCHLHSSMSIDSGEPIENYVKKAVAEGDEYFITTEHTDLKSHVLGGEDIAPDYDEQLQTVRELSEKYPIKVLYGIETGWRKDIHDRVCDIVKNHPFDMVILSVHETEYSDVSFPDYRRGRTVDECYDEYLSLITQAVKAVDDFDTFAHIDYLLRYIGDTDLSRHTKRLTEIFNLLIEKGKAFEINTKVFPQAESVRRADELLSLYTSLGGEKITLGSDGHDVTRHKNCFDIAVSMLKKHGINKVCVYIERKEHLISI